MATNIATLEDLENFKNEIIEVIEKSQSQTLSTKKKRWIKTTELQNLLGISASSIQNLRNNGTLPYTKLSGTIYYDLDRIESQLEDGLIEQSQNQSS